MVVGMAGKRNRSQQWGGAIGRGGLEDEGACVQQQGIKGVKKAEEGQSGWNRMKRGRKQAEQRKEAKHDKEREESLGCAVGRWGSRDATKCIL